MKRIKNKFDTEPYCAWYLTGFLLLVFVFIINAILFYVKLYFAGG